MLLWSTATSAGRAEAWFQLPEVLKLTPQRHFLLHAWVEPDVPTLGQPPGQPRLVTSQSKGAAEANTWYHLVLQSNGHVVELHVNGRAELRAWWGGALALPPRDTDGDLTFGCGMHAGVYTDTCSCLISEARAAERELAPEEWLWRPLIKRAVQGADDGAAAAPNSYSSTDGSNSSSRAIGIATHV